MAGYRVMYPSSSAASIAAFASNPVVVAMNNKTFPSRACLAAFALHALAGAAQAAASANLIVNGGAESGLCASDWNAVKTVPGWQVLLGQPTQVCHSIASFGEPTSPAPGNAFLADGPDGDAAMKQVVDVASASSAIDGGGVTFKLKGWLGGYGAYSGQAVVTASFLDAAGHLLGTPGKLAGATASARGLASKFLAESATGSVPAGTRSIDVQVQFIDTAPSFNVGYVDNLSLTLSTPVPAPKLVVPPSTVPAFDHVFLVMMENTDFSEVVGSSHAPFINSLAQRGALLANYNGTYHPSDENYLAIAGGDNFVSGAIYFPDIKVNAPHLGDELEAVGKTWKAYEQGMGTPCNTSNNVDHYYEPDDAPFINFTSISGNPARCAAHLVDTSQLAADLASAATTPNFAWIAADDYYDGEASGNGSAASLGVQDAWLQQTLQPIFASPAWTQQRSLLVLTWDESATSSNNHIATILYGSPGTTGAGALSTASYDHYSTGRTIEAALGLPALTANDRYAHPINDAFPPAAHAPVSTLASAMPAVAQGGNIVFDYATTPAATSASNWIGIYRPGIVPGSGSSLAWQYAGAEGGRIGLSTSSLAPGSYAAWLLSNGSYTAMASPVNFVVTP